MNNRPDAVILYVIRLGQETSMSWKHSTFILLGALLLTVVVSYLITADALRIASAADGANRGRKAELERAHAAIGDTERFLNFFRLSEPTDLTAEDYRRQIETLNQKYLSYYPDWAVTQTQMISESKVLAIAKAEIANRESWDKNAEYEIKQINDQWHLVVWRLPKTPGGSRYITIDGIDGNVVKYSKGK